MPSSCSRLWDAVAKHLWWHHELGMGISIPQAPVTHVNHIFMLTSPFGYCLTLQSSVNYPATANLTVISQTIKQAIKLFWIASSGPGRLETSPFNNREKPACDSFHVERFCCSSEVRLRCFQMLIFLCSNLSSDGKIQDLGYFYLMWTSWSSLLQQQQWGLGLFSTHSQALGTAAWYQA